jgi:hypothetical protein
VNPLLFSEDSVTNSNRITNDDSMSACQVQNA